MLDDVRRVCDGMQDGRLNADLLLTVRIRLLAFQSPFLARLPNLPHDPQLRGPVEAVGAVPITSRTDPGNVRPQNIPSLAKFAH